jgi:type I restriction enzyme, S subunit
MSESRDWIDCTIGEISKLSGGSAFKEIFQGHTNGEIPFIKVSDFNLSENHKYIIRANNWVSSETLKEMGAKVFPPGSVVFPKVGAALLSNRRRILSRPTALDNNLMAAIPNGCCSEYLYLALCKVDFSRFVQEGAVPSVNQEQVAIVELSLPPLPEQKKIAEILCAIDKAINKILEAIAKSETTLTGVFANLDLIASSGKTANLGEVASVQNGYAFQSSIFSEDPLGIPLIRISNISGGLVDASKSKRIPRPLVPSDEYKVNRGDILIAMSGATTGKMGKYRGDTFCLLNQRVGKFVFRPGSSSAAYVSQLLLSGFLESRILAKAAGGAQPNISGKGIEGIEIPYPDAADQEKYGSAIKELLRVNSTRRGLVEKYQHLKSALSSDLLSGRKRVSI